MKTYRGKNRKARWNEEWSITQDEIERWAKPEMKSFSSFMEKPKRLKICRKSKT